MSVYTNDSAPGNAPNPAESLDNTADPGSSSVVYIPTEDQPEKKPRKRRSRGAKARDKGARAQRDLAKRWRDLGIYPHARSTQGEQTRAGSLGPKPPDVEGTPLWVEAKHRKAARPIQALEQAEAERAAAGDTRQPIAVVRPHGSALDGAIVVMRIETFEAFARIAAFVETLGERRFVDDADIAREAAE